MNILNASIDQCISEIVNVYPKSLAISQNPVILIEYDEQSYRVFEKLKNAKYHLVDNKGNKYILDLVESNKAFDVKAQILLKINCKLKKRKFVTIEISNFQIGNKLEQKIISRIQSKKWEVIISVDEKAPEFESELDYFYYSYIDSGHGDGVRSKVSYSDNNSYFHDTNMGVKDHIIIKVTNEENKSYLIPTNGNYFSIDDGMCYTFFELKRQKDYTFKVSLIDFSGNESKDEKIIEFSTFTGIDLILKDLSKEYKNNFDTKEEIKKSVRILSEKDGYNIITVSFWSVLHEVYKSKLYLVRNGKIIQKIDKSEKKPDSGKFTRVYNLNDKYIHILYKNYYLGSFYLSFEEFSQYFILDNEGDLKKILYFMSESRICFAKDIEFAKDKLGFLSRTKVTFDNGEYILEKKTYKFKCVDFQYEKNIPNLIFFKKKTERIREQG